MSSEHWASPVAPSGCPLEINPPEGLTTGRRPVGSGLGLDELVALALLGEPERLVGDQLVGAEAVVQLDDVDLVGRDLGLLVGLARGLLRHVVADDLDAVGVVGESRGEVGDHRLARDLDRPIPEVVLVDVALGGDHGTGGAVRGRRARSFVSGSWIIRASLISSIVYSSWNCAYGLPVECLWFFHPIQA